MCLVIFRTSEASSTATAALFAAATAREGETVWTSRTVDPKSSDFPGDPGGWWLLMVVDGGWWLLMVVVMFLEKTLAIWDRNCFGVQDTEN